MSGSSISELLTDVRSLRFDPSAIQRRSLETLEQVTNGELDIVDPSNPFVFLLESSSVNTSAAMSYAESLTRQQYPSMAVTEDELYLHMSDVDYLNRFATPSSTTFKLLFNKGELINKAIETDIPGVKKLVIPRNTEFSVGEYTFTIEYPIELRVMGYGGIQVVYDVSRNSPLVNIESNLLDWKMIRLNGSDYVRIDVPANQFSVKSYKVNLSQSSVYSKTFELKDHYYYTRAYRFKQNGELQEIKTTHTDQVFDPINPTVILKYYENRLKVTVPQIYVTNGRLRGDIRIDIYTTKGPVDLSLAGYELDAFRANWRDLDINGNAGKYGEPIANFSDMGVYSEDRVTGGSLPIEFDRLRERVLDNALGKVESPITNKQVGTYFESRGFRSVVDIDNITNRVFLATRALPKPVIANSVSSPSCLIRQVQLMFDSIYGKHGVIDNGDRVTLTSEIIYKFENGIVNIIDNEERDYLNNANPELLVSEVNSNKYLYSPFHRVLDASEDYFETRSYYLDNPKVVSREFVEDNSRLSMVVNIDSMNIRREANRYVIQFTTRSGDLVKALDDDQLHSTLSVKAIGEERLSHVGFSNRWRKNDEWVFEFDLYTNFDIDKENTLDITNLMMFSGENRNFRVNLEDVFDLTFYVKDFHKEDVTINDLSFEPARFLLQGDFKIINHQKLHLRFGYTLEGFWNRYRSVVGEWDYQKHEEDVYATYEETVYEIDPETGFKVLVRDENNELQFVILHEKGDPVLDDEGQPIIRHRAGSTVYDRDGYPVIKEPRYVLRDFDLFLVDAKYLFSTNKNDVAYLKELPEVIISWLRNDIESFSKVALEQSDVYLYPEKTIGSTRVKVLDNRLDIIDMEQSFSVTYYMTGLGYSNETLKDSLRDITLDTLTEAIKYERVSTNQILSKLTDLAGDEVISITLTGLGGERNLSSLTMVESTDRLSIAKRLTLDMDGKLSVRDSIDVAFVRHTD